MTDSFTINRGGTKTWTLLATDASGATIDLTGLKIYATIYDLMGSVVFALASVAAGGSTDQIEILDQTADSAADKGKFYLKVTSAQSDLELAARWCDVWVETATERLKILSHAPFYILTDQAQTFV